MFYCEILSGLWIGDVSISLNNKFIQDNSIDIILNCSSTFGFTELPLQKIRLPFSDSFEADKDIKLLRDNKKKICDFIKKNILKKNILICCYDGKTISPLLYALYLNEYSKIDTKSIYPLLLEKEKSLRLWLDLSLFD